jgi:tetratricopeptide (TPR) repeat protein
MRPRKLKSQPSKRRTYNMSKDQIPLFVSNVSEPEAKCCHVGENLAYNGFEPTALERKPFRGIRRNNHLGLIHSGRDQQIVSFKMHTSETLLHAIYTNVPYIGMGSFSRTLEAIDLIPFAKKKVMEIYDEAIRLANLSSNPYRGDPWPYIKRGIALVTLGQYDKAIKDYSQVIHRYPTSVDVWTYTETLYLRGMAYYALNQNKNAILDYTSAVFFDPVNMDAFYHRALSDWRSGEHKKAISDYTRAICLDPNYTNAYYNRANSYLQVGQQKEAIKDYTTVLRLDPTSYHTYYTRALLYEKLGQHEEAIKDYTEVIRLAPENRWHHDDFSPIPSVLNHGNPYFKRAVLYLKLGQYEKAIKDFDFDEKRYHGSNSYQRGIAYAKLGDKEKAIKDYKEAVAFNPRHKKAINKKSESLAKMNS